jgi:NAD(P)-dependent dehydrogenase (short-subunit alcohol dehydrogenase family)
MRIDASTRAVVTGAGSGLGRAFALELARRGARAMLSDVNETSLDETVALVRARGGEVHAMRCDVGNADDVFAMRDRATEVMGGTDLVINNAGIAVVGPVGEVSLEDWRLQLDVNLWGVIHGCHAFVPELRARRRGHLVNVASMAGLANVPAMAPYNVTKAGVISLSETLSAELAPFGVGVTVLCPSFFPTNILRDARGVPDEGGRALARKLMQRSRHTADSIAAMTLDAVEKRRLYVLPHAAGRWMWRVKRAAPGAYAWAVGAGFARRSRAR